jgi:hypothetical protein
MVRTFTLASSMTVLREMPRRSGSDDLLTSLYASCDAVTGTPFGVVAVELRGGLDSLSAFQNELVDLGQYGEFRPWRGAGTGHVSDCGLANLPHPLCCAFPCTRQDFGD